MGKGGSDNPFEPVGGLGHHVHARFDTQLPDTLQETGRFCTVNAIGFIQFIEEQEISKVEYFNLSFFQHGKRHVPRRKPRVGAPVMEKLREHFKPEFLNRMDDILIFDRLGKQVIREIVKIQLDRLAKRLKEKRFSSYIIFLVVAGIYAYLLINLEIPVEKIHLLEYGLVSILLFRAFYTTSPDWTIYIRVFI